MSARQALEERTRKTRTQLGAPPKGCKRCFLYGGAHACPLHFIGKQQSPRFYWFLS